MKTNSILISILMLTGMFAFCGCSTNSGKNWTYICTSPAFAGEEKIPGPYSNPNLEAILDDYMAYLKQAEENHSIGWVRSYEIYESNDGWHMIKLDAETGLRFYQNIYLYYNKKNVRAWVTKGLPHHEGIM